MSRESMPGSEEEAGMAEKVDNLIRKSEVRSGKVSRPTRQQY